MRHQLSLQFLINSGATHNVLNESYATTHKLMQYATPASRTISSFDGSHSHSCFEISLYIDSSPSPSPFIITALKDAYNGILGMPWIRQHGHRINWKTCLLIPDSATIAAAQAVLSSPHNTPDGPLGKARKIDEGVCVPNTLAPPQRKHNTSSSPNHPELASKQDSLPNLIENRQTHKPSMPTHHYAIREAQEGGIAAAVAALSSSPTPQIGPLGTARMTDEGVCVFDTLAPPQYLNIPRLPGPRTDPTANSVATAKAVSLIPKNTPARMEIPRGTARIFGEGARVDDTLMLPQCEFATPSPTPHVLESAGKLVSVVEQRTPVEITAAKASLSTSAWLAADAKSTNTSKPVEAMVPRAYHRFLDMFRKQEAQSLPLRRKYDFRVELVPGATPQASRIIPLSPAEHEVLNNLVREGLANGTIRRTTSPWAAPVLFTGKKDGNLRPCFDYRRLNAVTVKNKYPLPLTMDLVDSLLDANTFTKLDLRNAYGNLRVAEGDKEKLAFICHAGQFAPLTMPFGPTGAPGYFQYFIQDILLGRVGKDVAAYLDDIMIYTQMGSDHEAAVMSVLETLSKHHLWLKPEKCEFSRPEVKYLGFSNFYRRFIDHFSGTARPLHNLTKAKVPFVWDNRCKAAFNKLKTAFTTAPVLKIANPYRPFLLKCDCSDYALGAVLSQVCDKDRELHPVAFLSRSLIQSEKNYEIFDKELLAIVAAFKEWCQYLEGNPHRLKAIVYTNH
ncbi:hypothetical protein PCANC_22122 [Puccinia coronata f. sp. avenae]|uniref:Reverse transcriptase domain-containing protein n=1 Tax=Puccinia coronata f. sp. avenae TaxID=200324 RepID=A0A2N5SHB9_9BASI|nr:hypothetical protein PCANC_22122 [Puccinia coronata f. sp. avenae]